MPENTPPTDPSLPSSPPATEACGAAAAEALPVDAPAVPPADATPQVTLETSSPELNEMAAADEATAEAPELAAETGVEASTTPTAGAPAGAAAANPPGMSPAACGDALRRLFPALFDGPIKPLKLRIQADIQARAPGQFSKTVLSAFLRRYTGSTAYLIALTRQPQRVDLDGAPAGELAEEHRQAAVEELARRRALVAERRAADDAQRQQRAHLLRDFERTTLTPANFCALKGLTPEALEQQLAQARVEALEPRRDSGQRRPDGPRRDHGPRRGEGPRQGAGPRGDGPRGEGPRGGGPRGDGPPGGRREPRRGGR